VRGARAAVAATFALNGLVFGTWASRVPAVRDRAGLSDGELGLALACIAVGAVVAMPVAGGLAARRGSRRPTRVALVAACAGLALVPLATSLAALCVALLVFGVAIGALDVAMNAHGVAVERRAGRPILSGLHAAFSAGGLAGGALGAAAAGAGLAVTVHLPLVAALALVVGAVWTRAFLPAGEDAAEAGAPLLVRPPRSLLALGALAFACLLIEGASADWSAVYLRDSAGASAAAAALGFTAFSVTMTAGRLLGDRLVAAVGPVRLVRAGGAVAALGFGLALLAGTPAAGIAGFACLGAGMAAVVPIVFRAAGSTPGVEPGVALAAVSSTGYLGFIAGPAVIGGIAEATSLSTSLVLLVGLGALVAVLGRAAA
jgi:MFS family permease